MNLLNYNPSWKRATETYFSLDLFWKNSFQYKQTRILNKKPFYIVIKLKIQIQAPVWENLTKLNPSAVLPPFLLPPLSLIGSPLENVPPRRAVIGPGSCPSGEAPGSGFGQQRRTAVPLLCCLVRRAAEGSGVCAFCCASVDQTAAAAVRFSSSRAAGIPGSSRAVHASDTRRRRILLSSSFLFWLIETSIFLHFPNGNQHCAAGDMWNNLGKLQRFSLVCLLLTLRAEVRQLCRTGLKGRWWF